MEREARPTHGHRQQWVFAVGRCLVLETQVGLRGGGTEISGERQGGLKKAVGSMAEGGKLWNQGLRRR